VLFNIGLDLLHRLCFHLDLYKSYSDNLVLNENGDGDDGVSDRLAIRRAQLNNSHRKKL